MIGLKMTMRSIIFSWRLKVEVRGEMEVRLEATEGKRESIFLNQYARSKLKNSKNNPTAITIWAIPEKFLVALSKQTSEDKRVTAVRNYLMLSTSFSTQKTTQNPLLSPNNSARNGIQS